MTATMLAQSVRGVIVIVPRLSGQRLRPEIHGRPVRDGSVAVLVRHCSGARTRLPKQCSRERETEEISWVNCEQGISIGSYLPAIERVLHRNQGEVRRGVPDVYERTRRFVLSISYDED